MKFAAIIICLFLLNSNISSQINYSSYPKDFQLYPRNTSTNLADVIIKGKITDSNIDSIIIESLRSDGTYERRSEVIDYSLDSSFSFTFPIEAILASYTFKSYLKNSHTTWIVDSAKNVVAGDVLLIQGQSNAQAIRFNGNANVWKDEFVRSYGNPHPNGYNDTNWYLAEGDIGFSTGSVGQWGLRLGRLLRDSLNIPIAIINGAHGGRAIEFFQRNDTLPNDITTNYGRLLTRLKNAGINKNIRSIFFYQGESDGARAEIHKNLYEELYWDWNEDLTSVESYYVIQVRAGCGNPSLQLRNYQRAFEDYLPHLTSINVNGLPGHDGCHYAFTGYSKLAQKAYYHILRDLYNQAKPNRDIRPDRAWYSNETNSEIIIESNNLSDLLTSQVGAESDFILSSSANYITQISAHENRLKLRLNSSELDSTTTLGYNGHAQINDKWILNQFGNGMFSFLNLKIDSFHKQLNYNDPTIMSGSGNALHFDGINDLVTINSSLNLSYTKEAWILLKQGNNHNNIISGSGAALWAPVGFGFKLSAGHNGTWNYVQDEIPLNFYQWTHVAVSYDHNLEIMKLYKNGQLIDSAENVPIQNGGGLWIGGFAGGFVFNGTIDEVKIWNKVQSVDEIRSNMCQKLDGDEIGLHSYYRFDEMEGSSIGDKTDKYFATLTNFENDSINQGAWIRSGTPIGTISTYTYNSNENLRLMLPSGERLELSEPIITDFAHLYFIQEKPNVIIPQKDYIAIDSQSSFGIYFVGNEIKHELTYEFKGNNFAKNLASGHSLDILKRKNNAAAFWNKTSDKQIQSDNITISLKNSQEYILSSKLITSIQGFSKDEILNIYPNPAGKYFKVNMNQTKYQLRLSDIHGRTILKKNDLEGEILIDSQFIKEGTYYITTITDSGNFHHALIMIQKPN